MQEKVNLENPCTRCGKERVVLRTWVEELEAGGRVSRLTHTLMVCPDPDCQEKVDKELLRKQAVRDERSRERNARKAGRPTDKA